MAKAKTTRDVANEMDGEFGADEFVIPEGFVPVSAKDGVRAWWVTDDESTEGKKPRAILQGIVMGRYTLKGEKPRAYYQIKITGQVKPQTMVAEGKGDERTIRHAEIGELVNVDEKAALTVLSDLVPNTEDGPEVKYHEVYLVAVDKRSMANGQSFWNIQTNQRPVTLKDNMPVPF